MSKFLKVEVVKHTYTDVYIEVPDDHDFSKRPPQDLVLKAVELTVNDSEWDTFDGKNDVDVAGFCQEQETVARVFPYLGVDGQKHED